MSQPIYDLFTSVDGKPRLVRGVAVYSGAPRLAELAIRIGFDTVWIEMEHGPTDFGEAEAICHAAEAAGGFGTIRVPDGQRCHVLRALETGARIVVVPMINTPDQARQVVQFGKFPPMGRRGYNSRSRGVAYGLGRIQEIFASANRQTHLFAQIETLEAVKSLEAICAVEGLSGIFIGPGDLSVDLGCTGDMEDRQLIQVVGACIRRARSAGRHAGILVGTGPLLNAALEADCDLCIAGGDYSNLVSAWQQLLKSLTPPKGEPLR